MSYRIPKNYKDSINKNRQIGFSLIEIMVAALILSIGILGVASLQIISMKSTQQSNMKHQAAAVIQNLTERMNSNKTAVIATAGQNYEVDSVNYNCATAILPSCLGSSSSCTSGEIAEYDLNTLICGYKAGSASNTGGIKFNSTGDIVSLVNGKLKVTCVGGSCVSGNIQIEVNWTERQLDSRETVVEDSIVLNTRIAQ